MSGATPAWEKQGATAWAQCPQCASWFPVAVPLVALGAVDLRCPGCGAAFRPEAARDVLLP
ncbi:MAG: hypothetical protein M5U08_10005 [Burkholderiales bacterium]|nr:hypothetical protein [Burkholderiales bacterium]